MLPTLATLRHLNANPAQKHDDACFDKQQGQQVMESKHKWLAGGAGLLLGMLAMQLWHGYQYPMRPLFVEIVNMRQDDIPLLKIEHGNDLSQEKILLTQLRSGESRYISLNHEPGKGYSVETQFADGQKTEACVGKLSTRWSNRVIITSNGVFSKD
ncbi:MAG TPA: hypothetical protein PLE99_11620 [Candidatus Thiothrix moscowensis]|uniref:hypothetical protein n=1 Tax=unclassified Thiothrix TaxID=2636184 RepID=UPI0025D8C813|nr:MULTISPECIES: hypothetical protein [unclassified Thiothrix]HRJ53407.1 hypothetical protein [Candidatus Thiothrix moscowensis]HRJ93486.1 hypothetical protein [Candidatus Thiothrix moscowensis]